MEYMFTRKICRLYFFSEYVFQAYETDYKIGELSYKAVLFQLKVPDYNEFQERQNDTYIVEVIIIKLNGQLVFTLTQSHVERSDLLQLASLVENMNEATQEFLNEFTEHAEANMGKTL